MFTYLKDLVLTIQLSSHVLKVAELQQLNMLLWIKMLKSPKVLRFEYENNPVVIKKVAL